MPNDRQPSGPRTKTALRQAGATFAAGQNIVGTFATGDHSTATSISTSVVASDRTIDINEILNVLAALIAGIPDVEPRALTRLAEAKNEAAKPSPEPAEITSMVEQAMRYASRAIDFGESAEKIFGQLNRVWDWAGTTLPDWASSLGAR